MKSSWNGFPLAMLALLVPAVVCGDVGPAFLQDASFPALRFDNLADYPQYDFYLLYAHGRGNPYTSPYITPVHSGEVLRQFEGRGRIGGARLAAVPRGQNALYLATEERVLLGKAPPGCFLSAPLGGVHLGESYLVPYRLHIEDDKLEVTMQSAESQPAETAFLWLKRLPCIAVPVAFCAALGWLGARMARRLFPPKPSRPAA
jgi:hypothetical protein